ncbi:MAG: PIN domain-containing protein [Acidimicrobiales bacterium]
MLDSEGLWAVARNDSEDARAVLASSREAGVPVLVPSVVLAETLFGDNRDARANQALKKLQVVPVSESVARMAAELKRLTDMTGVAGTADALVVAVSAAAGGGVVLTADADDIGKLAGAVSDVRIRPIRV